MTRMDVLKAWFGEERYARDWEYLEHNFGQQAQRVVDAIPPRIEIDVAGAMEKITPEMIDETKDLMIEGLMASAGCMREALINIKTICDDGFKHEEIYDRAHEGLPK